MLMTPPILSVLLCRLIAMCLQMSVLLGQRVMGSRLDHQYDLKLINQRLAALVPGPTTSSATAAGRPAGAALASLLSRLPSREQQHNRLSPTVNYKVQTYDVM
ncbi:Hypothetical predicted protein [Olea europaea subsp. europaea]|uniref:Secreted protein n=1 Tax=Olea europaea subsp. europaea TaxID=158383 RepID=A0A8S0SF47_OLEEU|nr:Hypothetical predicted protein [Olea europaea subsp. europaea]